MRSLRKRDDESKRREDTKRKKDLESRLLDPSLTNKKKRAHLQKELDKLNRSLAAEKNSGQAAKKKPKTSPRTVQANGKGKRSVKRKSPRARPSKSPGARPSSASNASASNASASIASASKTVEDADECAAVLDDAVKLKKSAQSYIPIPRDSTEGGTILRQAFVEHNEEHAAAERHAELLRRLDRKMCMIRMNNYSKGTVARKRRTKKTDVDIDAEVLDFNDTDRSPR